MSCRSILLSCSVCAMMPPVALREHGCANRGTGWWIAATILLSNRPVGIVTVLKNKENGAAVQINIGRSCARYAA